MPRPFFISYRRDDSAGHAGRLYDRLRQAFGESRVFMDVAIRSGERFAQSIDQAISGSTVLLAVIGREWLNAKDAHGHRRLEDPQDFVRLEIGRALARGARVVPVLVEGTPIPAASDLPSDIASLSELQAVELRDARWDADVDHLLRTLRRWSPPKGAVAALVGTATLVVLLGTPLQDLVARALFPPRPHDLRLRLVTTDGTSVARGMVTADFGSRRLSAPVGANGLAYFPEIPESRQASVSLSGVAGFEVRDAGPLLLPESEGEVLEVWLRPVPVVADGEVLDATGQPVSDVIVDVANGAATGTTDSAGRFRFPVPLPAGQLVEVTVRQGTWVGYRDTLTLPGPHKLLFKRK